MTLDDSKTIGIVGAARWVAAPARSVPRPVIKYCSLMSRKAWHLRQRLDPKKLSKSTLPERMALPTRTLTAAHHRHYRLLCETGSYMASDQHQWVEA